MTELLTAGQMRAVERAAMDSGSVTGLDLMERAGTGVVDALTEALPRAVRDLPRAVVLCGPGNNGGDGFVVARLLSRNGWSVALYLLGEPERLPADARENCRRWQAMGDIRPFGDLDGADLPACDLVVDSLFGTGLSRPLGPGITAVLDRIAARRRSDDGLRVVAVDLPSGLCSDSGRVLVAGHGGADGALPADLTVTFERPRAGHYLADGPAFCGKLMVRGIGVSAWLDSSVEYLRLNGPGHTGFSLPSLGKSGGHKYSHGHALVLTGGAGRTGAGRLAGRAALRVGAGLVTLAVPPAAQMEVAAQITALMLRRVAGAGDLTTLLEDARYNALCLGPGLGTGRDRVALVAAALESRRAAVLDADALTLIADEPDLLAALHDGCVLTPHGGEFARLFPDIHQRLSAAPVRGPAFSRVDAAREAAGRAGCTVLFKGPDTVIAAPDGGVSLNASSYDRAAPWLATAGSGDVLAGMIAGLLARGLSPKSAAEAAAWLHTEAARGFGPGLIAEDLPEELPRVFRSMGV